MVQEMPRLDESSKEMPQMEKPLNVNSSRRPPPSRTCAMPCKTLLSKRIKVGLYVGKDITFEVSMDGYCTFVALILLLIYYCSQQVL